MLNAYIGAKHVFREGVISQVSDYFNATYEEDWFTSEMSKCILKEIDGAEYLGGECIKSRDGTGISPRDLSTGCKALLILLNEERCLVSGDRMGDNCYPILLKMAEDKELFITICHWVDYRKLVPFRMRNADTGDILETPIDVMNAYIDGTYPSYKKPDSKSDLSALAENM